jgi:two-component system phosphate regulon response regulator PhoB
MSQPKILVIEDEMDIRKLISFNLEKEGWNVIGCADGEEGLAKVESFRPDVVLLDLMLPGIDGMSVCRKIRENPESAETTIIMITAKGEEADIVIGLELGADDYIVKPFSPRVLVARIRALLRRSVQAEPEMNDSSEMIRLFNLIIHPGKREILVDENPVQLTDMEFRLVHFLARRPGWVFTRNQIIDAVRGSDVIVSDRVVDVQVVGIRKKLGKAGNLIETVRGVGYRFKDS